MSNTKPTQNKVPSNAVNDLLFNSEKLDEFTHSESHSYVDRLGEEHRTLAGINHDANQAMLKYGYVTKKSFEQGATLDTPNTVLQWEGNGEFYRWDGDWSGPKVVPAGSTPESAGGEGEGKWVGVGDASLRSALGYITPDMYMNDASGDYSEAIAQTINAAHHGNVKIIRIGRMYDIKPITLKIPDGISIIGGGKGTGFNVITHPAGANTDIFQVSGKDAVLSNFSLNFSTGGLGSITETRAVGVNLTETSSDNTVSNLWINGKPVGTLMGFSRGVRCYGKNNKVLHCKIHNSTVGITYSGKNHKLIKNYCNNHFVDENLQAWNQSLPWWDGIMGEAAIDCELDDNICEYNGQSGVYLGGNNSFSSGNKLRNNTSRYNFNKGIDLGINDKQSDVSDVTNLVVDGNITENNRSNNLWLYGVNNSDIFRNKSYETDLYDTLFGDFADNTRAGFAVGYGDAAKNNRIGGNVSKVRESTPYGVVLNGTGHTIYDDNVFEGGIRDYWFSSLSYGIKNNDIRSLAGALKPIIRAGTTGLEITKGDCRYTVSGDKVIYDLDVLLTGTGAGGLYIGFDSVQSNAPTNQLSIVSQDVRVTYAASVGPSFIPGSDYQAYLLDDDPSQLCISRRYGADIINDIPLCINPAGTRFKITAEVKIAKGVTPSLPVGLSLFGSNMLSEQGFANGVGESLGLHVYNYARSGANSKETALVFGSIVNSYMPAGGVIPASGSVDLTPQENGVWFSGAWAYVTLAGVNGMVFSSQVSGATAKLTFTRTTAGSAVSVPEAVPLVVLPWTRQNSWSTKYLTPHENFKADIVIFQCSRNNLSWSEGREDLATMVKALGTKKFVILPEFPSSSETTGTAGATAVAQYNDYLKATYPDNFCQINNVDLLQNFKNHANPNYAQDVTDVANGVTPSSLRYDTLHPSRYRQANALYSGVQVNAEFVARFIKSKGWA